MGFKIAFADDFKNQNYVGVINDAIEIHLQWHDAKEWEIEIDRFMLRIVRKNIDSIF
ncbi:hypothetical protein [Maribacter sp. ACAM166]|uniref:hypothetical protein n=1 Tax=Maribacter sp. ACAM166 TaxID=2508996 RepID=UPI001484EF1C|nr:hypothetical protein [Maribacter sp. ACAM166]